MLITVIIPTYNRSRTLPMAILSLLRQGPAVDLDILIIDDGSTDSTPSVINELMHQHPQIRQIRQTNAGVTNARNTGLRHLKPGTEFVTFLDSDDLSPANRFVSDLPLLLANTELDLTYGKMMMVECLDYSTFEPVEGTRRIDLVGIHLSAGIYRRRLIERIGFFDVSLPQAEDTDYLLRIFESGAKFLQTETSCLYYLRHEGNMTNDTVLSARCFAAAVFKSICRRRADPSIVLHKPNFDVKALQAFIRT